MKYLIILIFAFAMVACRHHRPIITDGGPITIETTDNTSSVKGVARIVSLEYRVQGSMMPPIVHFEMKVEDGRVLLKGGHHVNLDKVDFVEVDSALIPQLQTIVKEEKMMKYKSHYSPKFDILDGEMWRLNIKFEDGKSISSSGENAYPSGAGLSRMEKALIEAMGTAKK